MDFNFVRLLTETRIADVPPSTDVDDLTASSTVGVKPRFAGNGTQRHFFSKPPAKLYRYTSQRAGPKLAGRLQGVA